MRSSRMCAPRSLRSWIPKTASPSIVILVGSPVYPGHFAEDWNHFYILEPAGSPVGAAVFLHGLSAIRPAASVTSPAAAANRLCSIAIGSC